MPKMPRRKRGFVTLKSVWADDHILCCRVDIDGNATELWWCGWEGIAAAKYANDCPRAMADLMELVTEQRKVNAEAEAEDKRSEQATLEDDINSAPVHIQRKEDRDE
jgi:hypothetical protein